MIVHDVKITTKVPDNSYDLGVKGQGKICLKSVLWLIMLTHLSFFDGVFIFSNGYLWQITTKAPDHEYDHLGVNVNVTFTLNLPTARIFY